MPYSYGTICYYLRPGKRAGWFGKSVEPAILNLLSSSPIVAQDFSVTYITVDVLRMGDTTAMIDTGAKRSAIALDLIKDRNSFPIKESMSNWRLADGEPARGVCGEISMTVSYRGHIIELPRVVVMRRQSAPFILGIEWIYAMRALVGTQDKKGVVILPEDKSILSDWTKQNEEKLVESSNSPGILLAQERKVGIE